MSPYFLGWGPGTSLINSAQFARIFLIFMINEECPLGRLFEKLASQSDEIIEAATLGATEQAAE